MSVERECPQRSTSVLAARCEKVEPVTVSTVSQLGRRGLVAAFLIATSLWALTLFVAPYLTTHRSRGEVSFTAAVGAYLLGSLVCHQLPERSFHAWGVQLPVCARCTGLYAAAPLGAAMALVLGSGGRGRVRTRQADLTRLRVLLVVAATPTLVTVLGEGTGLMHSTGGIRAAASAPLGMAVSWIVGLTVRGDLR